MTVTHSSSNREIRKMRPDEMDEFVTLMQIAFRDSIEEDRLDEAEVRRLMKKVQSPLYKIITKAFGIRMEFFVGTSSNKIASGIQLGIEKDHVYVGNLMTLPEYRRQGFARELLHLSFQRAHENDLKRVGLGARANNASAVGLYKSEGFEITNHTGRFDSHSLQIPEPASSANVEIRRVTKIPFMDINHMLDDCFPESYLEIRGREKFVKDYIPSRAIRFFARRLAGQSINTYSFYVNGQVKPRGFVQASQSNIEPRIQISSPILLEKDNDLLMEVIPRILDLESKYKGLTTASISCSMHRKDAIAKIESLGFKNIRESISMTKYL
ncbi:MAG: GNAT family N-acetyltransferase [Candidatus Thorarchaeota archaeon]